MGRRQMSALYWVGYCTPELHSESSTEQGVYYALALPFTLKMNLKAKEELWKLKYFTMQKYNLQKDPLKETQILQDIITL
jgi:hypothetical protein